MREKRCHDRAQIELDLVLVHEGAHHPAHSRDLSLGGMFVYTDAKLPLGTEVELQLAIASLKYEGSLPAVVRWQRDDGVGIAFRSLRARDVHAINQLLRTSERLEEAL